jgi:drug/metabolite transporter (DMT)-like permease
MLPIAGIFGDVTNIAPNPTRLGAALALGALSSGLAYILYYNLIAKIGATAASFSTYLIPMIGLFWGWLLLNEQVGATEIIGVVLILSGLAVATGGIRNLQRRLRVAQGSASR